MMFQELHKKINSFLDNIFTFLGELKIDTSELMIDHIGLRLKDAEDVEILFSELSNLGAMLSEAIINGRKIYVFKLKSPIEYKAYKIPCIELPYPASNHDYPHDGWEHVEFVLPAENPDDFEYVFMKRFSNLTKDVLEKYDYSLSIPNLNSNQLFNPTISFTKYKGLSVKFHPYPIEKIVANSIG